MILSDKEFSFILAALCVFLVLWGILVCSPVHAYGEVHPYNNN